MTEAKVYLAYEWTEEREGKNHIGVYSTLDKAKAACQAHWDDHARDYGNPLTPLGWNAQGGTLAGEKVGGDRYDQEYPFEVEEFDMDCVTLTNDAQGPRTFKTVRL